MRKKSGNTGNGTGKNTISPYKKALALNRASRNSFRIVKESPVSPKIDKAAIDEAVEKALLVVSR